MLYSSRNRETSQNEGKDEQSKCREILDENLLQSRNVEKVKGSEYFPNALQRVEGAKQSSASIDSLNLA